MKIVLLVLLGLILLAIGLGGAFLLGAAGAVAHGPGGGSPANAVPVLFLVAMVGAGLLGLALYLASKK